MTKVGETVAGADAAREGISQPAGQDPDWAPFCTRWEDKGRGGDSAKGRFTRSQKVLHRVLPILGSGLEGQRAGELQGA